MRKETQFVMVLAMALGMTGVPLWAGQHSNVARPPQPQAPHQASPSMPQQRVGPTPTHRMSGPGIARPYPAQRGGPRPPQRYDAGAQQRSVPRLPERNSVARPTPGQSFRPAQSGNVPRPPQNQAQRDVGRPPQVGTTRQGEPQVGNAQPSVPRPPAIGTPRDVHQGPHSGDWLRRYSSMPPQQRQRALESDPAFKNLPRDQQQRYRDRLNQFSSKSPQEQQRVINRMDAWGHLSQTQKDQARATYGQLKSMPADRQQQVNQAYRRLRAMPPSARQQVLNSPDFQGRFSPQERDVIKNMTDINNSLPH